MAPHGAAGPAAHGAGVPWAEAAPPALTPGDLTTTLLTLKTGTQESPHCGDSVTRGLGSSPAPPSTSCFTVSCSLIGAAGDRRHPVALLCKRRSCLRGVAVLAWTAPTPPCLRNLPCVPAGRSASASPSLSLVRSHSALHRAPRPHPRDVRGLFLSGSLRGGPRLPTLCLLSSWLSPHQSRLKAPVGVRRPHPCRG